MFFYRLNHPLSHSGLAGVVLSNGGFDQGQMRAEFFAHLRHCVGIFRKAGTAVTRPRIQEFFADAGIKPHPFCHLTDVGAGALAEIGHFVDIMDFHCQKGV